MFLLQCVIYIIFQPSHNTDVLSDIISSISENTLTSQYSVQNVNLQNKLLHTGNSHLKHQTIVNDEINNSVIENMRSAALEQNKVLNDNNQHICTSISNDSTANLTSQSSSLSLVSTSFHREFGENSNSLDRMGNVDLPTMVQVSY